MPKKPTGRPRGRPAHAPTAATRRQVSLAAGGGMRHEDIALAIGITRDTLTKHYPVELSTGASLRRLEVLCALHAAAKKGSSSAAKAYLAVEPQLAAPPLAEGEVAPAPAVPIPAPAPAARVMGKKEQAKADAGTAAVGTGWDELLPRVTPLQ